MANHPLGKMEEIKCELIPPAGAEPTGEIFTKTNGETRLVYTAMCHNPNPTRRPVKVDGVEVRRDSPNPNIPGKVLMQLVDPLIEREFILESVPPASVVSNYLFRPSPDEIAARQVRAAEGVAMGDLARGLAERGLTAGDLLDRVIGPVPEADTPKAAQPALADMKKADLVKLLIECGGDPDEVVGTGENGYVQKKDLIAALEEPPPLENEDGSNSY